MHSPWVAIPTVLLLLSTAALAQPVSPSDPLPGQPDRTYADLVAALVPGIVIDDNNYSGGQLPDIRHLGGWDEDGLALASTGRVSITAHPLGNRLALLLDFGTAADEVTDLAILALFDPVATPPLLDAVNASSDRWTAFLDPAHLPLGTGADLLLTQNTHFNSSQAYATTALTLVQHDLFEPIDIISTFSETNCAFERIQSLAVTTHPAAPFAEILATVTEQTTIPPEPCAEPAAPAAGTRAIAVTYRWDAEAERYLPDSDAFGILARENETRF